MDEVILVEGQSTNNVYDKDKVQVVGRFKGQTSYTTVLGVEKKVPSVQNAYIYSFGERFKY